MGYAGSLLQRLSPVEIAIYVAGAAVAVVELIAPAGVWSFPLRALPLIVFPVAILVALAAALLYRPTPRPQRAPLPAVAIYIAAAIALWLLRTRELYGDGMVVERLVYEGQWFVKREPLTPTIYLAAQRALGNALGWNPLETVRVVNTLAGAAGVVALVQIARRIAPETRAAAATVLVGSAATQLFAGYIELYTLSTVCMLWSIVLGIDALAQRRHPAAACALWTLSCMFHLSGLVFVPAIAWLAWYTRRWLAIAAVTLLPALVLALVMHVTGYAGADEAGFGGGDGQMFVPLFELRGLSRYLFLRPAHLLAIANEQLLVAPLGLVMLLAGLRAARDRTLVYLVLIGAGFFALTVIWNPDYGPLRDWDLFGPVGFYLAIAGVALVARRVTDPSRVLWFVAIVQLSRSLPFVLHNANL